MLLRPEDLTEEAEGFSFAQLREAFIMAGQFAFERGDDISVAGLLGGVRALRTTTTQVKKPKEQAGFRLGATRVLDDSPFIRLECRSWLMLISNLAHC